MSNRAGIVGTVLRRTEAGSFGSRRKCFDIGWKKRAGKNRLDPCTGWESTWEDYYCSYIKL